MHTAELVGTIIGLLLIAAIIQWLCKRFKLPFTVCLVLTGIGMSFLAEKGPGFMRPFVDYDISPEVILFVFLPTLIFESSFNLNFRLLKQNILPVLTLAVPGLILSTAIIGTIIWLCTPIDFTAGLLLGSILSATDPVAVISLFKQLGAPKRLTVLVEGESLFNDATSIVVAHILMGVVAAGYFSAETAWAGIGSFFVVFLGGILVGCLTGFITGLALGKVENDQYIEISLTTILAYCSFLIAEEVFHVSGVMATVAAGVTIGSWGRVKISPAVAGYMEHFWEYMAFVANALIFLLVGLRVDPIALLNSVNLLFWVICAMLISRAVVVFGLIPITSKLPGTEPVDIRYRTVMYWGGLRGAIALAIVLSLDDFAYAETFVALVMGAVLFTLMVQGLTIEGLMRRLGLDQPPLADRVAQAEGLLAAKQNAMRCLPELLSGGLFSARIADELRERYTGEIKDIHTKLDHLRRDELGVDQERLLLFARGFAEEKNFYYELFSKGHLSEQAYRDLCHSLSQQEEAIRTASPLPNFTLHPPEGKKLRSLFYSALDTFPGLNRIAQRLRAAEIARDYEETWGRYQGSSRILNRLEDLGSQEATPKAIVEDVRRVYSRWVEAARERLDNTAAQFPEFTGAMQDRLAGRLTVHAQKEVIEAECRAGILPGSVAAAMLEELEGEIRELRGQDLGQLQVAPSELLRKVPFFKETPLDEFDKIAATLQPRTLPAGEAIIRQGEKGDSLFLIARGVVRVSRREGEASLDLATLMAGDFFGEMALLHGEGRTATCAAVTPVALYELQRQDFNSACAALPGIRQALEKVDKERAAELNVT